MLPSEILIWQPEFTDKTLSRKPGAVQQGVITPSFFGLGGGINSEDGDTILVVLITPNVLNSGSSAVIKNVN
ncbi:hypothetical protein C5U37_24145 [Escherichia fergusonii]|uniref:hypothetical protein n=1 Tax=Escherichia fergusonii TaxID=564 RepID=UPI000CF341F3|nr:hypothetical protein [Escherichia fergusonii]PQI97917.1 hypothetical protein C5U37_24145 [Escherichia fergusonii]